MQFNQLKQKLKGFIVFSQKDIKKIDPDFSRENLSEWQKKDYIKKIIKGYYIFSDLELNQQILFIIANKIYKPSYVSLKMALSYYQLIPESVYSITSITTRHTYRFIRSLGNFSYTKIKPKLMFGYKLEKYQDHTYKIAEAEKALVDFFYANPRLKKEEDFEELRIDTDFFFELIDIKKMNNYLKIIDSDVLSRRVKRFLRWIEHA